MCVGCAAVPFDSRAGVRRQLAEPGAFIQLSPSLAEAEPSGGAGGAGRRAAGAGQARGGQLVDPRPTVASAWPWAGNRTAVGSIQPAPDGRDALLGWGGVYPGPCLI